MKTDVFTTRLLSLLAVQDGLVPASAIGVTVKQSPLPVKTQLKAENFALRRQKGGSNAKS